MNKEVENSMMRFSDSPKEAIDILEAIPAKEFMATVDFIKRLTTSNEFRNAAFSGLYSDCFGGEDKIYNLDARKSLYRMSTLNPEYDRESCWTHQHHLDDEVERKNFNKALILYEWAKSERVEITLKIKSKDLEQKLYEYLLRGDSNGVNLVGKLGEIAGEALNLKTKDLQEYLDEYSAYNYPSIFISICELIPSKNIKINLTTFHQQLTEAISDKDLGKLQELYRLAKFTDNELRIGEVVIQSEDEIIQHIDIGEEEMDVVGIDVQDVTGSLDQGTFNEAVMSCSSHVEDLFLLAQREGLNLEIDELYLIRGFERATDDRDIRDVSFLYELAKKKFPYLDLVYTMPWELRDRVIKSHEAQENLEKATEALVKAQEKKKKQIEETLSV